MQPERQIAIIGMAGRFPDARNLAELHENLLLRKCSLRPISADRIRRTTLPPDDDYQVRGYMDNVDLFDYPLFNIPLAEAQCMDPHQRLLLEVVYEAAGNAGFSPDTLSGTNTAVYVADKGLDYDVHAGEDFNPLLINGTGSEFLAARINRFFNLQGGVAVVDTSCSSSLVALHHACNDLALGDSDLAFVCGANLELFPFLDYNKGLEVDSPDGLSIPFSDRSNGMAYGEAVIALLLKPLSQAQADGDPIHAVILSTAVNNNAQRSASLNAPDSRAQADVILRAWRKAGVTAKDLGFVEAHGSGTQLGDSIEIGGLNLAFREQGISTSRCPVSTIKSNIGHTRSTAGLAGLVKAVLALKNEVIYPAYYTGKSSPIIQFDKAAVFVNEEAIAWPFSSGAPRCAGVSSMGFSGTNCHVVLQEAPRRRPLEKVEQSQWFLPFSAQTPESLLALLRSFASHLEQASEEAFLGDWSYTLSTGRRHFPHRSAFLVEGKKELQGLLLREITRLSANFSSSPVSPARRVLLFTDSDGLEESVIRQWARYFPVFQDLWDEMESCRSAIGLPPNQAFFTLLFHLAFSRLLTELTSELITNLIGVGTGRLSCSYLSGSLSLEEVVAQALHYQPEPQDYPAERLERLIQRETAHGKVLFVGMNPGNEVIHHLQPFAGVNDQIALVETGSLPEETLPSLLFALFKANQPLQIPTLRTYMPGSVVELPTYAFSPQRCWLRETPRVSSIKLLAAVEQQAAAAPEIRTAGLSPLEGIIARIWKEVLEVAEVEPGDNFFELGGDSLKATLVIRRLKNYFSLNLDFEDLFDYPVLAGLAGYLEQQLSTEQLLQVLWREVLKMETIALDDDFFRLGGHSLLANQILNRIRQAFGLDLHFEDFFQYPNIRQMAACIERRLENRQGHTATEIKALPQQEHYELSHAQKRLWALCQLPESAIAYNEMNAYRLEGALDRAVLERCLQALVERHESLRTVFVLHEGRPRQRILPLKESGFFLDFVDLKGSQASEGMYEDLLADYARQAFDFERGPLFQARLIEIAENGYLLCLKIHHIVFDDWSFEIIARELGMLYDAFSEGSSSPLAPLSIQYKDAAAWLNSRLEGENLAVLENYWTDQFSDGVPVLDFPTSFPRPTFPAFRGAAINRHFETPVVQQLNRLCRQGDSSMFMVILAALQGLLYRYSGQTDLVLGIPAACREALELENQVGFYANTLPVRTRFQPGISFAGLLELVREAIIGAYRGQLYPLDLLMEKLDLQAPAGHAPFFDILAVYKKMDTSATEQEIAPGLIIKNQQVQIDTTKYDLDFTFIEYPDRLEITLVYNTDLFVSAVPEGFLDLLQQLICQAAENPEQAIEELDLVGKQGRETLKEWGETPIGQKPALFWMDAFSRWVAENPDAPAIQTSDGMMTYGELEANATLLAQALRRQTGFSTNSRIGIWYPPNSPSFAVAVLGVNKAGAKAVFLPTDYFSASDLATTVSQTGLSLVFGWCEAPLPESPLAQDWPIWLKEQKEILSEEPTVAFEQLGASGSFVFFSRRTPQGGVTHPLELKASDIGLRLQQWMTEYPIQQSEVLWQEGTGIPGAGLWQLLAALSTGSTLIYLPEETPVAEAVREFGVTQLFTQAERLPILAEILSSAPRLHRIFGWSPISAPVAIPSSAGGKELVLLYGTAETAFLFAWQSLEASSKPQAITRPAPGSWIRILDSNRRPQAPHIWGEVWLGGIGVVGSYLDAPALEPNSFLADPFFGETHLYRSGSVGRWTVEGQLEWKEHQGNCLWINGNALAANELVELFCRSGLIESAAVLQGSYDSPEGWTACLVPASATNQPVQDSESAVTLPKEEHRILEEADLNAIREFNQTDLAFPDQHSFFTLFECMVERFPEEPAATDGKNTISYRRLWERAEELAAILLEEALPAEACVPVFCDRSIETLVAMLALFRLGLVYVPLTTDLPAERIRQILEDCEAGLILSTKDTLAARQALIDGKDAPFAHCRLLATDAPVAPSADAIDRIRRQAPPAARNLAYLIFTSGSTGRPKGAMIEHVGMINHLYAKINSLQLGEHSRIVQNASQSFDISIWQFLSALLVGGTTLIFDEATVRDPLQFTRQLEATQPTILELVPSYLSALLEFPGNWVPQNLHYLLVTGETLKYPLVQQWFERFPSVPLVNAYGPTEASDDITHAFLYQAPESEFIPIGKPVQNMRIYIVDEVGNLCPIGVKGEIWVSGIGVGRGYRKQAEKTALAFGIDPFRPGEAIRLYKTGDLGCFLPDGNIRFFGRKDFQVKVRGHRIELGDIEQAILKTEGVKDAVVQVFNDHSGQAYLCGYFVAGGEKKRVVEAIRQDLPLLLPAYMIPAEWIAMDVFPLTAHGKIDRKALPAPMEKQNRTEQEQQIRRALSDRFPAQWLPRQLHLLEALPLDNNGGLDAQGLRRSLLRSSQSSEALLPQNDTERCLLSIWQQVLGRDLIRTDDHFFEIGGHSIRSIQVAAAVYRELQVAISPADIFTYPTIQELAGLIRGLKPVHFENIQPLPAADFFDLSHAQRRMWILAHFGESSAAYNIFKTARIKGDLDRRRLEKAFIRLMERQESLRTAFISINDHPKAFIRPASQLSFSLGYEEAGTDWEEEARQRALQLSTLPFDLEYAPLFRVHLMAVGFQDYVLTLVIHHIIADGWSMDLLINEVFELYLQNEGEELAPLAIQYKDFASWQNDQFQQPEMEAHRQYWLEQFRTEAPVLQLPLDHPRPALQQFSGGSIEMLLGEDLSARLRTFAQQTRTTFFMQLMSGVVALLARYSGQEQITVGAPIAGREHPDVDHLIGVFINTLALKHQINPMAGFSNLLQEVKGKLLEGLSHQAFPFDKLVDSLELEKDLSRSPLFDVMVVWDEIGMQDQSLQERLSLSIEDFPVENTLAKFDLTFHFMDFGKDLNMGLSYNRHLFSPERAEYILRHLRNLLAAAVQSPEQPLSRLVFRDAAERDFFKSRVRTITPQQIQALAPELEWPAEAVFHGIANQEREPMGVGLPGELWIEEKSGRLRALELPGGEKVRWRFDGTLERFSEEQFRQAVGTKQAKNQEMETEAEGDIAAEENLLLSLAADLLGRSGLTRSDDFFRLGGDSIKAIQLVSRLYQKGRQLEVREVFHYPHLAQMARRIRPLQQIADQGPVVGEFPLSPIQADFFARPRKFPHHYNQSLMVYSQSPLVLSTVEAVLRQLAIHHDALRAVFPISPIGERLQVNQGIDMPISLQVIEQFQGEDLENERIHHCEAAQAGLSLEASPLWKALLFKAPDGDRLALFFHHLIIDGVSWRILLEDIFTLFQQSLQGIPLQLPLKTDSFQAWSKGLSDYARSAAFERERAYWQPLLAEVADCLPAFSGEKTPPSAPTFGRKHILLSEAHTTLLLGPVHQAYGTEMNDLLLAALGQALRVTLGLSRTWVMLESHGRAEILPGRQFGRSVGWFTSMYPFLLRGEGAGLAENLINAKDALRKVPNQGVGYGIARYLRPDAAFAQQFEEPGIVFNFLGQFDQQAGEGNFSIADEYTGNTQAPGENPEFALQFSGLISTGQLEFTLIYDATRFSASTMEQLIQEYQLALENLIEHCTAQKETVLTSSDFGYSELDFQDLDKLFD